MTVFLILRLSGTLHPPTLLRTLSRRHAHKASNTTGKKTRVPHRLTCGNTHELTLFSQREWPEALLPSPYGMLVTA
ncbi:hypothetical protein CYMTET_25718 [Cymbomonas tetramitiformis]|uniref:Uncharacterized protein n=1 Tax=Cymbomonas tetramitiformis TaxID=36881 RepID=A0AAE0FUS9_9CHLO|nr:hypothetical protein CYMTET_25718 [Cymbomonas tetramitiformis]